MSFKKKPQSGSQIHQAAQKLNMLLGLGCSQVMPSSGVKLQPTLTRQLILSSAMFWDSKKRIDKIKSLILKDMGLEEFNDSKDFQISQLSSIELLSLSKNSITYLHPLSALDTLVCLNINHNKIYDITPLQDLHKLQQLYASNNQITHIDSLKQLKKLRILNLYANKIQRMEECLTVLEMLLSIEEIDVEENPGYKPEMRNGILAIRAIVRVNGELVLDEEREELGLPNSSVVMVPSAKFRDTHTSFFNMNKSKISKSTATNSQQPQIFKSKSQLQQEVNKLEQHYLQIDDRFEEQIVKNVHLKSELLKKSEQKKMILRKQSEIKDKQELIAQLKRKVKMLKQNLFNNPENQNKCELLRELFELQMMGDGTKSNNREANQAKGVATTGGLWVRKFDYDEEIVVASSNDDKYLFDEDQELALLLSENNSALQQIKEELRQMNQ